MKKFLGAFLIMIIMLFGFTACANGNFDKNNNAGNTDEIVDNGNTADDSNINGDSSTDNGEQSDEKEITKMYITVNGNKLEVNLEKNSSVDALVERLKQGDITYTANDYGGFEKVGGLGFNLPENDAYITSQAGDVILYSGNQIVLFYGSNSWLYTKLGKINGYSASELRTLLYAGYGSVQVTISL